MSLLPEPGFHPVVSDDLPRADLKSTFVDHTAIIGRKVRVETTWTYKRNDGRKNSKYRKERWRVRAGNGRIVNRAHYIGRIENGEFIASAGKRAAAVPVAGRMAE